MIIITIIKGEVCKMSTWNIDVSHTNVGFTVRHMMVSNVRGNFTELEGTVEGDPENLTDAKINIKIDTNTINTNNEDRDNHLRSADFFDVEKNPHIIFQSTDIKKTGDNEYDVTGDLTVKDVTKQHTFKVTHTGTGVNPWGVKVVGFEGETKISRKEFDLTWNQTLETGGVLVGDEIKITIEGELNPA